MRLSKLFWIFMLTLLGLVAAAVIVIYIVQSAALAAYVDEHVLPALSAKIGRRIEVGETRARVLPRPHAELVRISVEGAPGEPPLLSVGRASATVELWPLLRSLGKDLRISGVELGDATVDVVRRPDGTFSFEDVLRRLHGPPSERPIAISQVRLRRGQIVLLDRSRGGGKQNAGIALDQIDATAHDVGAGRPTSIELKASFASKGQNITASAARGDDRRVHGHLAAKAVDLESLRAALPAGLENVVTGGVAGTSADVSETKDGRYDVAADVRVDRLELRGQPASGSMHLQAEWDPGAAQFTSARAERIVLKGPGIDLGGSASLSRAPTRIRFDLRGPLLELGELLSAMPPRAPREGPPTALVPADYRAQLGSMRVSGALHVDRVVNGKLTLGDFDANADLERGTLDLKGCTAKLYDGTVDLSGSTVDLDQPRPAWHVVTRVTDVNMASATSALTGQRLFDGRFGGALDLRGSGSDWPELRSTMTGSGQAAITDAALPREFEARLSAPVQAALSQVGLGAAAAKALEQRWADKGTLEARFIVENGWARLTTPLRLQMPFGTATLTGRVALDRRLDLAGKLGLSPMFVKQLTGGRLAPSQPVDLPIRLAGTLQDPRVDLKVTAEDLGRETTRELVPRVVPPGAPRLPFKLPAPPLIR